MTIKEVEQITGLTRSNIRFYEKEKLITPDRNENNGYREYSEEDIKTIKKVAYLRTLGISIEDIRRIANKEIDLFHIVKERSWINSYPNWKMQRYCVTECYPQTKKWIMKIWIWNSLLPMYKITGVKIMMFSK